MKKKALKELKIYEEFTGTEVNKKGILKTFDIFSKQGHTGFTSSYALDFLYALVEDYDKNITILMDTLKDDDKDGSQKMITSHILDIYKYFEMVKLDKKEMKLALDLLDFRPLAPLLGTDDEWTDTSSYGKDTEEVATYQNNRYGSVFKSVFVDGMEISYTNNVTYSEDGGNSFFTGGGGYSRKEVTFPYVVPKEREKIYLYRYSDNRTPIVITDKDTIENLYNIKKKDISLNEDK